MGTSIHSRTPFGEKTASGNMFFDKEFLVKCHEAMSERKMSDCAGSEYFKYQLDFVRKHYILYDGAFEGIRDACAKNGYKCHFHTRFDNPDLLTDGWSDIH